MNRSSSYSKRIYEARDVETLRSILADISADTNPEYRPFSERNEIFRQIRNFTERQASDGNLQIAREVILADLWPLCISFNEESEPSKDGKKVSRRQASQWEANSSRELLGKWLAFWVENGETDLRDEVIGLACDLGSSRDSTLEEVKSACWTLGQIGFRSSEAEQTLWRIFTEREDVAADVAGSILIDLGLSNERREDFTETLLRNLKKRPIRYNVYAAAKLRDPQVVDSILNSFDQDNGYEWVFGHTYKEEDREQDRQFQLSFHSTISDELWNHADVQEKVWAAILAFSGKIDNGYRNLFFLGNLVPRCDSKVLLVDYLSLVRSYVENILLSSEENTSPSQEDPTHRLLEVAALRLKESVRPNVVIAWPEVHRLELKPFLRLATIDSKSDTNFSTSTLRAKSSAWEMLAMAGGIWNPEEIATAIEEETSGYSQGAIAKVISCFAQETLLPWAEDELIRYGDGPDGTRELDEPEKDSSPFYRFRGAENLARATANRPAFDALLKCNAVFYELLRSTCEALNDVTLHLLRGGEQGILEELWKFAGHDQPKHRRGLAISAIHTAAGRDFLPASSWSQLIELASDATMDEFYRSLLVQAVGFLEGSELADHREQLQSFWLTVRAGEDDVALRAHEMLARLNLWRGGKEDLYLGDLGIEKNETIWRWKNSPNLESERMVSLAFLYRFSADEFEGCVCDVLESEHEEALYALTYWLLAREPGQSIRLRPRVVDVIVQRLKTSTTTLRSYLFDALAIGAPEALMKHQWGNRNTHLWDEPTTTMALEGQSRLALAKAYELAASTGTPLSDDAVFTLELFIRDPAFPIRRAAFRTLSRYKPSHLAALCELALLPNDKYQPELFERRMAAEGAFWLETEISSRLREHALIDVDYSVRQAAKEGEKAYRDRLWANQYQSQIEHILHEEQDSPRLFVLGAALQILGDDSHLDFLKNLDLESQHPRLKCWRERTRDELKKNWDNKIKDWRLLSEGAFFWSGPARLIQAAQRVEVEAWIWFQPRGATNSTSSWGGQLAFNNDRGGSLQDLGDHAAKIEFGGRESNIIITQYTVGNRTNFSDEIIFRGQGRLPYSGD